MSLRRNATLTPSKLAAQRSNARRSTGPSTDAGKARSRWNALRHGAWAGGPAWSDDALRAIGEDPEEFQKLRQSLLSAHGPADDPLWGLQIEDLARLYWRRRRLDRAWQLLISRQMGMPESSWTLVSVSSDGLPLLKQIEVADRAIDRKVRLIMRMREVEERRRPAQRRTVPPDETDPCPSSPESPPEPPCDNFDVSGDAPAPTREFAEMAEGFGANSKSEERSQNVDENKRAVMSDK